VSDELTFLLR